MEEYKAEAYKTVAVFDFDDTLIFGDSMKQFLIYLVGWPALSWALIRIGLAYLWLSNASSKNTETADAKTFFKQRLVKYLIAKKPVASFDKAIAGLMGWREWNEPIVKKLREHFEAGHHIVIATGALSVYMTDMVKDLPHHGIVCTDVEVKEGIATANLPNGNCVRSKKAELVAQYMRENRLFGDSWGYGNLPDDMPMLNVVKNRVVV
jgi:phosphoserine phosphatase